MWVLERVCADLAEWRSHALVIDHVAVNISPAQLRDAALIDNVARVFRQHGIAPGMIEFEITESLVMEDVEANVRVLNQLHELGAGIAIDDFGTGYSSLAYLRRFPIQKMKIDRSFVAEIINNSDVRAIARAVISLGRSLNLDLVAEGVEHADQAAMLAQEGCQQAQGFLFSKAISPLAFRDLLMNGVEPSPI